MTTDQLNTIILSYIQHHTAQLQQELSYTPEQIHYHFVCVANRLKKRLYKSQQIPISADGHVADLTGAIFHKSEHTKTIKVAKDHGQRLDVVVQLPHKMDTHTTMSKNDLVAEINYQTIEFIEIKK